MIISEKQIWQLIALIETFTKISNPLPELILGAAKLVDEIRNQQSNELKTIE